MENQRETRSVKTPSGKELVLKTYLTARERNELRGIFLGEMKVDTGETGKAEIKDLSGASLEKAEHKLIELAIVAYDGSAENILNRLLDSMPDEYDFAVREANKTHLGNFQPPK